PLRLATSSPRGGLQYPCLRGLAMSKRRACRMIAVDLSVPRRERSGSISGTGTVTETTKVRLEAVASLPGTDGSNPVPSSSESDELPTKRRGRRSGGCRSPSVSRPREFRGMEFHEVGLLVGVSPVSLSYLCRAARPSLQPPISRSLPFRAECCRFRPPLS